MRSGVNRVQSSIRAHFSLWMEQRPSLSAVLITRDAAGVLTDCLSSLRFTDEILIVDGGSSDGTVELATSAGARVITHPWSGFGPQKRFAVDAASHDWVLCVDADERVPERLAEAIRIILIEPQFAGYLMPRKNYFLGRYLSHGEGYPDWSLRLFDRRAAQWSADLVHEKVQTTAPTGRITSGGALLHHSADSLAVYLDKQNRYTTLQAEGMHERGERASNARMLLAPLVRFLKFYVMRAGFLDGIPGLVHIAIGCHNSFMKYAKLRELQHRRP
jgi:glycosyltransferase involved in cell wall biosynthesis